MSAAGANKAGHSGDRSHRSLAAMHRSASTSRVLNLAELEKVHGSETDYLYQPLFRSRVLNTSLIVKHRFRADEAYMFDGSRQIATKLIVPFSRADLSLGGQSTFVGSAGWKQFLAEVSNTRQDLDHDLRVMEVIDRLPSLDPFLLRESLRQRGHEVASCYFALSSADIERMHAFVTTQIQQLIQMAFQGGQHGAAKPTARLVEALLSTQVDERLEPLRKTLMLDGDAFREGVFSWKGFLYYKWALSTISGDLNAVIGELASLVTVGPRNFEAQRYFDRARSRLKAGVLAERRDVLEALKVYDDAFRDLTANGHPVAFREFLLKAPAMFITLGEKIGGIAHIASFWRYRFPKGKPLRATVEEAAELVRDFEESLCIRIE